MKRNCATRIWCCNRCITRKACLLSGLWNGRYYLWRQTKNDWIQPVMCLRLLPLPSPFLSHTPIFPSSSSSLPPGSYAITYRERLAKIFHHPQRTFAKAWHNFFHARHWWFLPSNQHKWVYLMKITYLFCYQFAITECAHKAQKKYPTICKQTAKLTFDNTKEKLGIGHI